MKVIIVGAGEVGRVSAETISNIHDVLVIERDELVLSVLKSRLNVSTLKADGTNPKTLKYAIENHEADMIIATLGSDSENLFLCLMAKRVKPSIITVSSVNNPDYMIDTSSQGVEGVDTIISPELITAQKMYKLCVLENAIDFEYMANTGYAVAMFTVESCHDIVGKVVMHLKVPDDCTVFAIYRDDIVHTDTETMEIHPGDRICVFGSDEALNFAFLSFVRLNLRPFMPFDEARFILSWMDILALVPFVGSWNILPIMKALLYSGAWVISLSFSFIVPDVTGKVPAIILKRVDLPEPFEPITQMTSPSLTVRFISSSASFSFTVPGKKTFVTWLISSIVCLLEALCSLKSLLPCPFCTCHCSCLGDCERDDDKYSGQQLEVIWSDSDEISVFSSKEHQRLVYDSAKNRAKGYKGYPV